MRYGEPSPQCRQSLDGDTAFSQYCDSTYSTTRNETTEALTPVFESNMWFLAIQVLLLPVARRSRGTLTSIPVCHLSTWQSAAATCARLTQPLSLQNLGENWCGCPWLPVLQHCIVATIRECVNPVSRPCTYIDVYFGSHSAFVPKAHCCKCALQIPRSQNSRDLTSCHWSLN